MRFTVALLAFVASVVAQDTSALTPCVLNCLGTAIVGTPCGSFTNITCVCTNTAFQSNAASCLEAQCTPEELVGALGLTQSQCAASGTGSTEDLSSLVDLNPILGALLIGAFASCVLFGITTAQTYVYSTRFPDDRLWLKLVVGVVWTLEALHGICVAHLVYVWTITDYGHPERLLVKFPPTGPIFILVTVIIKTIVILFFSYRIYILSHNKLIPCFTCTLSTVRIAQGFASFAILLRASSLDEFNTKFDWLGTLGWSLDCADDIVVTTTLVTLLWLQRSDIPKQTTALIDKIIKWTLETGMMSALFSLTILILYKTMPNNLVFFSLFVVQARVFSNQLLASLNSRGALREMRNDTRGMSFPTNLQLSARVTSTMNSAPRFASSGDEDERFTASVGNPSTKEAKSSHWV